MVVAGRAGGCDGVGVRPGERVPHGLRRTAADRSELQPRLQPWELVIILLGSKLDNSTVLARWTAPALVSSAPRRLSADTKLGRDEQLSIPVDGLPLVAAVAVTVAVSCLERESYPVRGQEARRRSLLS